MEKLHDKMGLMDETADICVGDEADIVKQFRIHNTKGVVISLVLPVDREAKLIWQSLTNDVRLGRKVVGCSAGGSPQRFSYFGDIEYFIESIFNFFN